MKRMDASLRRSLLRWVVYATGSLMLVLISTFSSAQTYLDTLPLVNEPLVPPLTFPKANNIDTIWNTERFKVLETADFWMIELNLHGKSEVKELPVEVFEDPKLDSCWFVDFDGLGQRELVLAVSSGGSYTSASSELTHWYVFDLERQAYLFSLTVFNEQIMWTPYEDQFDEEGNRTIHESCEELVEMDVEIRRKSISVKQVSFDAACDWNDAVDYSYYKLLRQGVYQLKEGALIRVQ